MGIEHYDLIIVGGGIHGAGVAQCAAARGHSTLVLEQRELAFGTSSRSSKLIHGGLRYLESGQFSLVRECLRERALLLQLAPELVRLVPFHIPVYRRTSRRPWQLRLGLSLYALLGGLERDTRFHRVPRRRWDELDGLLTQGLEAVYQYYDAQTDDAALTRAVMRSAESLGAEFKAPASFQRAELNANGAVVSYRHRNNEHQCQGRVLVNAAGPWVKQVLDAVSPAPRALDVELVQGTHIILNRAPHQGIYYVEAPSDRRAVFVMPWQNRTLVGTTEHIYEGDPSAVQPLPQERDYLKETLVHYFPRYRDSAIEKAFAGLRVLPKGPGSPFGRSRDTLLLTDREQRPRLLSIYGGKLTAYRATAEQVMDRLMASLPPRQAVADTRRLMLHPA